MGRVNRAIELLEGRHTLIYGGSGDLSYEGGVNACHTDNDFLLLEQEHVPLNITGVREFMRGLAAAGPNEERAPDADRIDDAAHARHRRTCGTSERLDGDTLPWTVVFTVLCSATRRLRVR